MGLISYNNLRRQEVEMKVVTLCSEGSCCPVVKISDTHVEIGEEDNTCTLSNEQWETLKEKILSREV